MAKRMGFIAVIVTGAILALWLGWTFYVTYNIESPRYRVLQKNDAFEVRLYEPYIAAYVDVPGDHENAINQGFRILANYIFGGNTRRESIAMTAPVTETVNERIAMTAPVTEQQTGKLRRITFMMPGAYTLDTLPKPDDERIRFHEAPGKKCAATRFTWYPTEARVERKKAELIEWVELAGLIRKGEPIYAAYNDPYSFPLLQRHEILIEVQ
ncbi:MAG: heme-binding protein [Acidobacteria bacterium]|nr:heme-binding protein [Acidobacteriota bacterium]